MTPPTGTLGLIAVAALLAGQATPVRGAECSYASNPEPARIEVTWMQPEGETTASFYPAGEIVVTRKGLKPLFACLTDIEGKRFAELGARPGLKAARCLAIENAVDNVILTGTLLDGARVFRTLGHMPAHLKDLALWCGATAKAHFGEALPLAFPEPGETPPDASLDTLLLSALVAQFASAPGDGPRGADAVAAEILARRDVEVIPYLLTQVNSTKSAADGASVRVRSRGLLRRLMGEEAYSGVFGADDAERYDLNEALTWFTRTRAELQKDWAERWVQENPTPCK